MHTDKFNASGIDMVSNIRLQFWNWKPFEALTDSLCPQWEQVLFAPLGTFLKPNEMELPPLLLTANANIRWLV